MLQLLLATAGAGACSRTSTLSGDVFIVVEGGDVKRGADTEVVLVASTAEFDTVWRQTGEAWAEFLRRERPALREGEALAAEATRVFDTAWSANLRMLGRPGAERSKTDAELEAAKIRHTETHEAVGSRRRALWARFSKEWDDAMRLIRKHQLRSARTDINGRYSFEGLPRKKYYVYAANEAFHLTWFVPVEVTSREERLDLARGNSGPLRERPE